MRHFYFTWIRELLELTDFRSIHPSGLEARRYAMSDCGITSYLYAKQDGTRQPEKNMVIPGHTYKLSSPTCILKVS
jgi:hypothetical protein